LVKCFASEITNGVLNSRGPQSVQNSESGFDSNQEHAAHIYLATDGSQLRASAALRIHDAVRAELWARTKTKWDVSVDYFSSELAPSHFMDWTRKNTELSNSSWDRLVGTTAEWIMMSQGNVMLMAKGLDGGHRALPSSYGMSSAAYGQVEKIVYLEDARSCELASYPGFKIG